MTTPRITFADFDAEIVDQDPEAPPPAASYEEVESDAAPSARTLTQPHGPVPAGVPTREETQDSFGGSAPSRFVEGHELRPGGGFPPGEVPGNYETHQYHHHIVETRDVAATTRAIRRLALDATQAVQVLPRDAARIRATVLNRSDSSSVVTLGSRDVVAAAIDGFDLSTGSSFDVRDSDELWAAIPAGGAATLQIWATRNAAAFGDNQN